MKIKKRCIHCEHKLTCLGTNVCVWDKDRIKALQKILDGLGGIRWPEKRGMQQVSLRWLIAYGKFDREFRGSRNQRRGDAIIFMKKHSKYIQRWFLNQKRTAFICHEGAYGR